MFRLKNRKKFNNTTEQKRKGYEHSFLHCFYHSLVTKYIFFQLNLCIRHIFQQLNASFSRSRDALQKTNFPRGISLIEQLRNFTIKDQRIGILDKQSPFRLKIFNPAHHVFTFGTRNIRRIAHDNMIFSV